MTHSIIIPVMNELHNTKGILGLLKHNTSHSTEFIFIDNGSTDNYEEFIYKNLRLKKVQYIRNNENIGLVKTMQQGYEASSSEIITFVHNDVFLYEKDWDKRIENIFHDREDIGVVGLFGAAGVGSDGGRIQMVQQGKAPGYSGMIEAEVHGEKISPGSEVYVSIMDGFLMSVRKELLDKTGGFDQTYQWHHFYDRDLCLESIRHGYKNLVIGSPSHHWSGRTANQPEYQEMIKEKYGSGKFDHTSQYVGDKATHDDNMKRFGDKWGEVLPIYVDKISGDLLKIPPYKGERIIGYAK